MMVIRVHRKGIIVIPKSVREALGIEEGSLLQLEVRDREIVLRPLDLWERVWGCAKGMGNVDELERALDEEEASDELLDASLR